MALLAGPLAAHDMWIEPETFRPEAGVPAHVELCIGDHPSEAERVPRDPRRIVRFVVAAGDATEAVEAPEGVDADWESFWASLTFELPAP